MTEEQKENIIKLYNSAVSRAENALDRFDSAPQKTKLERCASDDYSFSLGIMEGFDSAIEAMGYSLIVDESEGGNAVDIVNKEEAQ